MNAVPQFRLIKSCMLKLRYAVQCPWPVDDLFLQGLSQSLRAQVQIFDHRQTIPESRVIFKAATQDFWMEGIVGDAEIMVTFMKASGSKPYEALLAFLCDQQSLGKVSSS